MASSGAQAARFRDIVDGMINKRIEVLRPGESYGTVTDIDRLANKAWVSIEGGDPVAVTMEATQPYAVGQRVVVGGPSGDKKIVNVTGDPTVKVQVTITAVDMASKIATGTDIGTGQTGIPIDITLATPGVFTVPAMGETWWIESRGGKWAPLGKTSNTALDGLEPGDPFGPILELIERLPKGIVDTGLSTGGSPFMSNIGDRVSPPNAGITIVNNTPYPRIYKVMANPRFHMSGSGTGIYRSAILDASLNEIGSPQLNQQVQTSVGFDAGRVTGLVIAYQLMDAGQSGNFQAGGYRVSGGTSSDYIVSAHIVGEDMGAVIT